MFLWIPTVIVLWGAISFGWRGDGFEFRKVERGYIPIVDAFPAKPFYTAYGESFTNPGEVRSFPLMSPLLTKVDKKQS